MTILIKMIAGATTYATFITSPRSVRSFTYEFATATNITGMMTIKKLVKTKSVKTFLDANVKLNLRSIYG